jgi:hypothetical protein
MPDDEYQKYERACKRIKKANAEAAGAVRPMALWKARRELAAQRRRFSIDDLRQCPRPPVASSSMSSCRSPSMD